MTIPHIPEFPFHINVSEPFRTGRDFSDEDIMRLARIPGALTLRPKFKSEVEQNAAEIAWDEYRATVTLAADDAAKINEASTDLTVQEENEEEE